MSEDTEEWLTTRDVLNLLREAGITDSEPQVRKWLRDGSIPGSTVSDNRKSGRRTPKSSVIAFIRKRNPLYRRVELLEADNAKLRRQLDSVLNDRNQLREKLATLDSTQKRVKYLLGQIMPNRTSDHRILFAFDVMSNLSRGLDEQQIKQVYELLRDHSSDIIERDAT